MCRNIRTRYHFCHLVTDDEMWASSPRQFELLTSLVTSAPPKNHEVEAAQKRKRSAKPFGTA